MTDTTTKAEAQPADGYLLPKRQINLIYGGLIIVMLLSSLDQMIFSTALPTIVGELNGVSLMLWVTTAYILASTIMMPIYGKLGDLLGRKPLLIGAITVFMAGSIVGGLADDMFWLIAGRAIQGIGGGGLMILSQATIADIIPPKDRGRYMGPLGAVFGLAAVLGPILGGWFTESIGWRWAFWMNIPLGLVALASVVAVLKLPKKQYRRSTPDVLGIMLMAIAVTCLVLFTSWGGNDYDWDSPVIISLIAGTIVAGTAFFLVERKAAEPIIPPHLFKDRNFVLATAAGLIIGVVMFGAIGYMPTYMQMVHDLDATASGFALLPMVFGLVIAGLFAGQVASRTAHYKWIPLASVAITGLALFLLSTLTADTELWQVCVYLGVFGIGLGLGMQLLVLIVQNSFPVSEVGTATAGNNFFRQIGSTLGAAVVGSLFVSRLGDLLAERLPSGGIGGGATSESLTPALVDGLDEAIRHPILTSYNDALVPIFLFMIPLLALAFILLLFIKETPLATSLKSEAIVE